ncbi:adenosylcobyric acid synthase (glutamine-hydrolysing) [Raineyella antarctica]|uniref:Cobyric acid synthase n=1 Tax=Raineyella antarctica TaxID=1577474 RepID=A0A1G6GF55_9ACTN|nr:cobyric acid synthase [Raineyella antarctica]SDB80600.1 adenosylcobyric acid synthase (glutamine-hydrolysing) [Raineyella antarctica]
MAGVLVAGTSSDAGKSLLVTGLCRALVRRGVRVAPFKAQNMSNNSMVVAGPDGRAGEIGRAQWLQARAARLEPTVDMNPVLLKPSTDRRSHVVLRGQPHGTLEAGQYAHGRGELVAAAFAAYEALQEAYDLVVCEGAGSPAEINLRAGDYVNMGLARRFGLPVALVGDIDRGGMLAAVFGTWGLLEAEDRALLAGYVVNKFRGDVSVLEPGLVTLSERTGLACFGVVPWLEGVWLDSEDTLKVSTPAPSARDTGPRLSVAVVRLPRVSNATDLDALGAEPGIDLTVTTRPDVLAAADLVVVPGSRSTIGDLDWLRTAGLDRVLAERATAGRPVLGICGGYQLLGRTIADPDGVEAGAPGTWEAGLGLLPVSTVFHAEKSLGRPRGEWAGHPVVGYEIHHGVATVDPGAEAFLDGARSGAVFGTMWHGTMEDDAFRHAFLAEVAGLAGSGWRPDPSAPGFDERRETMIDSLADAIEEHAPALLALALDQLG